MSESAKMNVMFWFWFSLLFFCYSRGLRPRRKSEPLYLDIQTSQRRALNYLLPRAERGEDFVAYLIHILPITAAIPQINTLLSTRPRTLRCMHLLTKR